MNAKKVLTIILIVFIVGVASFLIYFGFLVKTKTGNDSTKKVYEVKERTSTLAIANDLEEKNLVKSSWAFYIYAKLKEKPLQTGSYLISKNMTIEDIVKKISDGKTAVQKLTIPEGYRAEQIAQVLDEKKFAKYADFLAVAKNSEGKIFPDTYYITTESSAKDILDMMLTDYDERIAGINVKSDDLVLASIVEREAKNDSERAAIAGVYKNRLKKNMKLEADPTVLYANDSELLSTGRFDYKTYQFWQPVAFSEYLKIDSPYNTYVYAGLPPTAICNPGLKSIEAALNPENNDYLYFFHDKAGKIYFSETVQEHDQKKALYLK